MPFDEDWRKNSGQPFFRLHDLAARYGDGLIPELYDLFARETEAFPSGDNVVIFPEKSHSGEGDALEGDGDVVQFPARRNDI